MSLAAPPEKKAGPRELHPNSAGKVQDQQARGYRQSVLSASLYSRLIVQRWASGLLPLFKCYCCGAPSLDPCGRLGKGQWLCRRCADGRL
jgi:hypothetical protein